MRDTTRNDEKMMNSIENHDNWETFPANKLKSACWTFSYFICMILNFKFIFFRMRFRFFLFHPVASKFVAVELDSTSNASTFFELWNIKLSLHQHTTICTMLNMMNIPRWYVLVARLSSTNTRLGRVTFCQRHVYTWVYFLNYNFEFLPLFFQRVVARLTLPQLLT